PPTAPPSPATSPRCRRRPAGVSWDPVPPGRNGTIASRRTPAAGRRRAAPIAPRPCPNSSHQPWLRAAARTVARGGIIGRSVAEARRGDGETRGQGDEERESRSGFAAALADTTAVQPVLLVPRSPGLPVWSWRAPRERGPAQKVQAMPALTPSNSRTAFAF